MNYTESFDQFASRLGPTDLALYAGAGIIIWILFQDKLKPIKNKIVNYLSKKTNTKISDDLASKILNPTEDKSNTTNQDTDDIFFELVLSWKQTRDLAVKSQCYKAVEVADQMFPFLSPQVCSEKDMTK